MSVPHYEDTPAGKVRFRCPQSGAREPPNSGHIRTPACRARVWDTRGGGDRGTPLKFPFPRADGREYSRAMKPRTRLLSSVIAVVLAASGVVAAGALPASARTAPVNKYVALGDSYAAGQGGGGYVDSCLQSPKGYPALLDAVKGTNLLRNASCSLATTGDVTATQLSVLNRGTTLVTLTVGGNDLNVAGVAAACTSADQVACANAISAAGTLLTTGELAARLAGTYAQVAAAAPRAHVVVTGYPLLFADSTDPLIDQLNAATMALNQTIQGVVASAQAARPHSSIEYVDVSAVFAGHAIGDADSWVYFAGPDAFHPTPAGYQAYAAAILAAL